MRPCDKRRLRPHGAFRKKTGQRKYARPLFVEQGVQPHQQQRIAARFKKSQIRPGRDLWHNLTPHALHGFKQRVWLRFGQSVCPGIAARRSNRRDVGRARGQKRALQTLAVGLARGAYRDVIQHVKQRGVHVFGQQPRQL